MLLLSGQDPCVDAIGQSLSSKCEDTAEKSPKPQL